jgi:hypothetical protein
MPHKAACKSARITAVRTGIHHDAEAICGIEHRQQLLQCRRIELTPGDAVIPPQA